MAGGHKHKWTRLLKQDYFGEKGFYNPTAEEERAINLDGLRTLLEKMAEAKEPPTVNLSDLGVSKLVGKGFIDRPVVVAVEKWSSRAEEKILAAGGRIIKPQEIASQQAV